MRTFKLTILVLFISFNLFGAIRRDKEYKIYQFPKDQIPRIDGEFSDWEMVPDSYSIGLNELKDTEGGHGTDLDPINFDIKVKVAWVKDLDRLYFYVEAEDDYWSFDHHALTQDIFELVDIRCLLFPLSDSSRVDEMTRISEEFNSR